MKNFILALLLINLFSMPIKTNALEAITHGATQNATLLATAGTLLGGLSSLWFVYKASNSIGELESGKEIKLDLIHGKCDVDTTKDISMHKALFNLLKNKLGYFASFAVFLKSLNFVQENVFKRQIDPNFSVIDAACIATLIPAITVGTSTLIKAIIETNEANNEYDEDISAMHHERANRKFKVYAGSIAVIGMSFLLKEVLKKALIL